MGDCTEGQAGVRRPLPRLHQRYFYLSNDAEQLRVSVVQQTASPADLAILEPVRAASPGSLLLAMAGGVTAPEASVVTVGYAAPSIWRTGHGRVQEQLLEGREQLLSAQSDFRLSGSPVLDMHGRVVGMVTGGLGQASYKSRMLTLPVIYMTLQMAGRL